jgi:hypothetical protein
MSIKWALPFLMSLIAVTVANCSPEPPSNNNAALALIAEMDLAQFKSIEIELRGDSLRAWATQRTLDMMPFVRRDLQRESQLRDPQAEPLALPTGNVDLVSILAACLEHPDFATLSFTTPKDEAAPAFVHIGFDPGQSIALGGGTSWLRLTPEVVRTIPRPTNSWC